MKPSRLLGVVVLAACSKYEPTADPCRPHDMIANEQLAIIDAPEGGLSDGRAALIPTCKIDDAGVLTMTFTPPPCTDNSRSWYAGCTFAANQDLSRFDVSGGGQGLLAAHVCVDGFVASSLNLRYGSVKATSLGKTKYLPLIDAAENFSGSGCRLVYFAPADACYSSDRCGTNAGCETLADGSSFCDSFGVSQLTLMNEFCAQSTTAPEQPVVVKLETTMLFGPACICNDDSNCARPNVCRRDGWGPRAQCALAGTPCSGVCMP